jgi:putative transposase
VPWREMTAVNLRHQFVLRALEPDPNISALCRDFGISRKTGYKWIARFKSGGLAALEDLSRRPHGCPMRVSGETVLRILEIRDRHPRWGPRKIWAVLGRELAAEEMPSTRTVARVLDRAGRVAPRRRRPAKVGASPDAPNVPVEAPNDLWTVDFKGWWETTDGGRAEPLTIRDGFARFVLAARLLPSTNGEEVRAVFEEMFRAHGLPKAILVDNGSPFASTRARGGLTQLSAWWVSQGIRVHRSRPGKPQDNGGHERMHRDIASEVQTVPAGTLAEQQVHLDAWRHQFNHVRPHDALDLGVPASIYVPSPRPFMDQTHPIYPPGMDARRINRNGYMKYGGSSHYVGQGLAGHIVGIAVIDGASLDLYLHHHELGRLQLAS